MERITQTSSMHSPRFAKISLISMLLCPNFMNWKGDFSRLPVLRSVLRWGVGMGWPWYLVSIGLGSNVSTWLGPPLRNRKMTRLALGAKCVGRTSSGLRASSLAPRMPPRPSIPNPLPIVRRAPRRVMRWVSSLNKAKLIGAEQDLRVLRPRIFFLMHELQAQVDLLPGWRTAEQNAIGLIEARPIVPVEPGGARLGLIGNQSAIHEEHPLPVDDGPQ